jgi:transcription elongation factor GreA
LALELEMQQRIKKKNLDEVETAWNARVESQPTEVEWFLEVARELKNVKAQARMGDLIGLLADALGAADEWELAFDALQEGVNLAPRLREIRVKVIECIRERYAGRADLDVVIASFGLEEAEDPAKTMDELRDWLRFGEGEGFWLFGRGLGKVQEVNLALQKVKLRFEKAAPLVVRRDEARKILTWIPPDHFMMRRLDSPAEVKKEARSDPGEIMRQLLACFRRPLTASEIKECMTGVVEGGAWTAWWAKARSHPRVLPSKGKKGAFEWMASSEEAEKQILGEFESAPLAQRMALARRHDKRGGSVKEELLTGLAADLATIAPLGTSEAVELALLLEELGGLPDPNPLSVDDVLRGGAPAPTIASVSDRRYRERLYARLPEVRPDDWVEQAREAFFLETDQRLLTSLYELIRAASDETAARLVAETIGQPRKSPSAFVWTVKSALAREELAGRATAALLSKVAEALEAPEFKELKAHLREHFDEGGLAFVVFEGADPDAADHLLTLIDGAGLEEHRKTAIRRAIFRKYPNIRKRAETEQDVLWSTAEAAEEKRGELEKLVRVEIPEATEAIRVAREYGDLSENFEYHAARQKHEVLSTRAARLQREIRKVRIIDPAAVDPARVSIGTRVELRAADGGATRSMTILGPWESDPDTGVFSYLSEFAKRILGRGPGEEVTLENRTWRVASIEAWATAPAGASADAGGGAERA